MKKLDEIRGNQWIAYLLDKGKFKNLADMHGKLNVVNNVQLWSAYKKGTHPVPKTIDAVNEVIPGSAELYNHGKDGLPLWAVLSDKPDVWGQIVIDLLNECLETKPWMLLARKAVLRMTDAEKLKAMLEIVLPESLWYPSNPNESEYVNPLLPAPVGIHLKGWLSLAELFSRDENALAVAYIKDKADATEKNIIKSHVYSFISKITGKNAFAEKTTHNLSNVNYVIGFMALIQICNSSRDKSLALAPDFIKNGIYQAVLDNFGDEIAELMKGL